MNLLSGTEIAEDRLTAEANMPDWCRITRPGDGPPVRNEETGAMTDPERVVVYEGRCRLQVKADINSNVVETTAGDREWTYLTATLQVPIFRVDADGSGETGDVRPDDVAVLIRAPHDPSHEGREFNVQGMTNKTVATHRRFRVREVIQ